MIIAMRARQGTTRQLERRLLRNFLERRPILLAALCDGVASALALYDEVEEELRERGRFPRMADFAVWAEAGCRAYGLKPFEWLDMYDENRADAVDAVLESDPVASALLHIATEPGVLLTILSYNR